MMQPCASGSLSLLRVDEGQMGPQMSHIFSLCTLLHPTSLGINLLDTCWVLTTCQPYTVPWAE